MLLKIERFGKNYTAIFKEIDRFNINNAESIKLQLLPIIKQSGNCLTLDLENVSFIDSSGFQVLIALLKTAELYNSRLEVMNISSDLKELFDLLSLSDVFQITAN